MFASLSVFIVLVGLILLSVVLFGDEVASGPLQISLTLAALYALGVAFYYGFRGPEITQAIRHNINATIGVIFIIIAVGTIIGCLFLAGTVPAVVYYGIPILTPKFFYIIVFILCSIISMQIGSSFTTAGALGVAFIGLASIFGVSLPITAGAVVAGASLGDKICRFSDTYVMTIAAVGGVNPKEHDQMVKRTAIPVWIISAILFIILGFTQSVSAPFDLTVFRDIITQYFNISLLAFLPFVVIIVLSYLRLSGFLTLMISAISSVILAGFTQKPLITALANNPNMPYPLAVVKVGIDTFANGFHLNSGIPALDQLFSGGGTISMLETIWLILIAVAFAALVDHTGIINKIIAPIVNRVRKTSTLITATSLTSIGLNVLTADYNVSIVLTAKMFRDKYIRQRFKPVVLSTVIADSGTIISSIIPWNVHGVFFGSVLGVGVLALAPFAFLCYLSPLAVILASSRYFSKKKLPDDVDAKLLYGKEASKNELVENLHSA